MQGEIDRLTALLNSHIDKLTLSQEKERELQVVIKELEDKLNLQAEIHRKALADQ